MTATAGLFFDSIVKTFGGTHALRGVSLRIERGEIVALLGENGAGKSTLIKTLGGIHKPDSGQVSVDGVKYEHLAGKSNESQAVAFIHQDLGLIEWMSVAENIALAIGYKRARGRINWRETQAMAEDALMLVEAEFSATARVSSLSRTEKSLVAIARALAVKCDFLVLDEPTASLPADEVARLFNALRPLKEKGVGMIYVSHRLDEIFQIADRVAVLRDGQMVGLREVQHTTPEELVSLIVGRKTRDIQRPEVQSGPEVLTVRNLVTGSTGPIDFSVKRGELVGLVGLRGAGHEDVGRSLFGVAPHEGKVLLDGQTPDLTNPQTAMASGFGFVARDRVNESVAPSLTIRENAFLNPSASGRGPLSFLSTKTENQASHALGQTVGLSPNDPTLAIEALSGGNQQKIVVGRWIGTNRTFLIAEDPTAGVDVGAKAEIYHLLFDALSG
ncbi:MAG: sugar ABC transporter ATP-binding protein, partial [Pseudomonadota bacterium]